jgi:processive 1,2-diacylglycerol beta-glucosyltransferase
VSRRLRQNETNERPVLILTIANGAGHIRLAQGLAATIRAAQPALPVLVVDVADYMTRLARFTHVTSYLWIVKHAPAVWDRIDRYQKTRTHTSPEWYYRRGCKRLFELARLLRPRALVATEVGCCEIAALIKRDLSLRVPLIAVNDEPETDRAWVKPEVDLYCFGTEQLGAELISCGAPPERVATWGVPLAEGYGVRRQREKERVEVCRWLALDPRLPLILIAGGGEGMGRIEETAARLLHLKQPAQLVVLTGRNERLKSRCERLEQNGARGRWRVLGWTEPEHMAKLMFAADLMVSKLGSMFNEAIAAELPIIALEPPPGAERVQYRLLEEWNVGCAVRTLDEVVERVEGLLEQPHLLEKMRQQARAHQSPDVSQRIASWLVKALSEQDHDPVYANREAELYALCASSEQYRSLSAE